MFGIGMPELIIILVVALLVVGPKKLPNLAKSLGKGLTEFRKATDAIKSEISENETYKDFHEVTSTVKDTVSSMNPKEILDVDAVLEPKKPEENIEARQEAIKKATSETDPAEDDPYGLQADAPKDEAAASQESSSETTVVETKKAPQTDA
jgi:sec-independent protein translocase protein TatB